MAVTKVDIASQGLVLIGANKISSFDDNSTEAQVASTLYEENVESLLSESHWRFAMGQKQLSLLADAPTSRYEYAYQMPTDPAVITIMTVTNNDHPIPYSRYGDKIYLNGYGSESNIYMDYVFRQDESLFPTYFRLALVYRLASVFGAAIGRDADILQSYEVKAERQLIKARNIASQETTTKKLNTTRFAAERRSSRSGLVNY
jgi:hypothetical protein|tara:strand:+ start:675 stop:1283 length:609 start_codon:yes stop_codon:yes gene_type:complete